MKKDVVLIDDNLHEGAPPVKKLKEIVEKCNFNLKVLNTRKDIDSFVKGSPGKTGMVLLDRDLHKIKPKITPVEILDKLKNRNIPIFIFSQNEPTVRIDEDFRTLYSKGVIDYIHKDRMDEDVFMKNLISSTVNDINNDRFKLVVKCDTAEVLLLAKDPESEIARIDFASVSNKWKERQTVPTSNNEIILRIWSLIFDKLSHYR